MLIDYTLGQTSVIIRVKLRNSSVATGAGLTALTNASSGLVISTIADNEATATSYTSAGATIDSITTLGTFAAPTAGHVRFKEVDNTNHKGIYELQIDNLRFNVGGSKSLLVSISGASNLAECDICIPLRAVNPYDGVHGGMTALPNAVAAAAGGLPTIGTGAGQVNPDGTGAVPVAFGTALPASPTASTVGEALKFADTRLDVATSTRLASASYTTPPTTAQISTAIWQDLTSSSDFTTAGSIGKLIVTDLDTNIGSRLATSAYTTPPTTAQISTAIWQDLTSSSDFTTASSIGKLLVTNLDTNVGSVAAAVWGVATRTLTGFSFAVTVGGYSAGQDPATLMYASSLPGSPTGGTFGNVMVNLNGYDGLVIRTSVSDTAPTAASFKPAGLSGNSGDYVGLSWCFTSGGMQGRKETISAYDGVHLTFNTPFPAAPANGDKGEIV